MTDTPDPIPTVFEQLFREATPEEAARPSEEVELLWVVPVPTLFNPTTETATGVLTKQVLRDAFKRIQNEPLRFDLYEDGPFMRAALTGKPLPKEAHEVIDEPQVLDTILDHTLTTYKVEYQHVHTGKGRPPELSWVVEYANLNDYPEAYDKASRLAMMYAHVRVVRIEKTERLTVAWASNRTS